MTSSPLLHPRLTATALVAAAPAALAAHTLVPHFDRTDKADELAAVAAHPVLWQAACLAGMVAALCLLLVGPALAAQVRGRGAVLARVGGVLIVLGALGQFAMQALNFVLLAMTRTGARKAEMVKLAEEIETTLGFGLVLGLLLGGLTLGCVLIAIGQLRSGEAPRWVPTTILVSQLALFAVPTAVGPWIAFPLLTAGLGWYAANVADASVAHRQSRRRGGLWGRWRTRPDLGGGRATLQRWRAAVGAAAV